MSFPVIPLVKSVVEITVSAGVGTIVGNVVKQNIPENMSRFKKITVMAGGFALSGMAGAAAASYASTQVDAVVSAGQAVGALAKGVKEGVSDKKVVVVDKDENVMDEPIVPVMMFKVDEEPVLGMTANELNKLRADGYQTWSEFAKDKNK